MAREYAQIRLSVWDDDTFRALPPRAQHLYFVLLTSPTLSYAGVADWRPSRISGLAGTWTRQDVEAAAYELVSEHFIVVDEATEEVLIRSFVRNDGIMTQPRMAVSMVNAHRAIASSTIRQVVVHELKRLHAERPHLAGWNDTKGNPGLALELTQRESLVPADLASVMPSLCPSISAAFGSNADHGLGAVSGATSPAPTPAPLLLTTSSSEIADAIPDQASSRDDVDRLCEALADRIEGNGSKRPKITKGWRDAARLMLDRDGRTEAQVAWLIDWCQSDEFWRTNVLSMPKLREKFDQLALKAKPHPAKLVRQLPEAHLLERPPDGLSPAEYDAWDAEQRARRAGA